MPPPCWTPLARSAGDATKPPILGSKVITRVDHQHAFLINRNKLGSMIIPGESLYTLEMQPASYAILAANEAEKAANIKIIDYRMIGANGRVYLAGSEAEIPSARDAAETALRNLGADQDIEMSDPAIAALIREVLAEELARIGAKKPKAVGKTDAVAVEHVAIASDGELAPFVPGSWAMRRSENAPQDIEQGHWCSVWHDQRPSPPAAVPPGHTSTA